MSSQNPSPSSVEKAPIPARTVLEMQGLPPLSRVARGAIRLLAARKATTTERKNPVIGTLHPYEMRALHLGHLIKPHVSPVRQ